MDKMGFLTKGTTSRLTLQHLNLAWAPLALPLKFLVTILSVSHLVLCFLGLFSGGMSGCGINL